MIAPHAIAPERLNVDEGEFRRMLGYPAKEGPSARAQAVIEDIRRWFRTQGRPWVAARAISCAAQPDSLLLDGRPFPSTALARFFQAHGVQQAVLVAVSAGPEVVARANTAWQEGKPDEYYFAEVYGSAVMEHLQADAQGRICARAETEQRWALPAYCPGFDDWDVAENVPLVDLARDGWAELPGPLEVLPSGMLQPKKTLLTLVGLASRDHLQGTELASAACLDCPLPDCRLRRATYRFAPEDAVPPLFSPAPDPTQTRPLNGAAHYSVNDRALRKWSEQRLRLETTGEGGILARFRFEGSTCSNLGHPLAFDYTIALAPPEDAYRILETRCEPAEGDEGHTRMCAYRRSPDELVATIAEPPPVLGRPLDEILAWTREPRSTGCYCDAGSRAHKWGLALETLHFALARKTEPTKV